MEFVSSGIVRSPESLIVEAQGGTEARDVLELRSAGGILLSASATSGQVFYDPSDGQWKIGNGGVGAAPIMSGINGVPGPGVTLEGGTNITITPDPANNKVTIDAQDTAGIETVNGENGPDITITGSSGIQVSTTPGSDQVTIGQLPGAFIVGYSGFQAGTTNDTVITHNLDTSFVVPRFVARSGPAYAIGRFFDPAAMKVLSPNAIGVRMDYAIDYDVVIIGMKG